MAHLEVLVALVPKPRSQFLATFIAGAACYQYWPCRDLCWLVLSETYLKNDVAVVGHEFRRWGPDVEMIIWIKRWILRGWDLWDLHLSVRFANNESFECSQLKAFFPHPGFSEGNKRVHLRLHLLYPDNNRFENSNKRALEPSRPNESSNSLYPWIVRVYYGQWELGLCVCSLLGSASRF